MLSFEPKPRDSDRWRGKPRSGRRVSGSAVSTVLPGANEVAPPRWSALARKAGPAPSSGYFRPRFARADATMAMESPAPTTPVPPPPTSSRVTTVDRIDIVDSPAGATSGYPLVTTGDLNQPGPFNDRAKGVVSNIHQIRFHLDQGDAADVTPIRTLQRTLTEGSLESKNPADIAGDPPIAGGFEGILTGPDGPPAHEIQRPSSDTIVVADAPGNPGLTASQYPFVYRSHFHLRLVASAGIIARVDYDVRIDKQSPTDIPNTENTVIAVRKEDTARGRGLS